jgi:phosphoheptose isomerase
MELNGLPLNTKHEDRLYFVENITSGYHTKRVKAPSIHIENNILNTTMKYKF